MNDLVYKLEEFGYMLEDGWVAIVHVETEGQTKGAPWSPDNYFVGANMKESACQRERDELAAALFDASLRGKWIHRIALGRSDGFNELNIELKTHPKGRTNITGEVMDGIMKLMMPVKLKEAAE